MTTKHTLLTLGILALALAPACGGDDRTMTTFGSTGVTAGGATDGDDPGETGDDPTGADPTGADPTGATSDGTGGDTGADTGNPLPDLGGDDTTGGDPDPDPDPDISSCSNFYDGHGLFDFVNAARRDYGGEGIYLPHARYKGIPWQGSGHDNWTFSTQMAWDDDLAAQARAEAQQLVAGANPHGTKVNGQASVHNPMWIDGINTGQWKITIHEDLDDWQSDPSNPFSSDIPFALDKSNGSAREGLHYHDFGGDGPAIHRLGVGGALGEGPGGECQVWWVLQFGE